MSKEGVTISKGSKHRFTGIYLHNTGIVVC